MSLIQNKGDLEDICKDDGCMAMVNAGGWSILNVTSLTHHSNRLGLTQDFEPARENRTFPTCGALNGPSSWTDHTKLRISMQCRIS